MTAICQGIESWGLGCSVQSRGSSLLHHCQFSAVAIIGNVESGAAVALQLRKGLLLLDHTSDEEEHEQWK